MMDFIYELYKNDNFTLYLTIALVVLIILFVIVFFFGKKDQKLEETKRLQKIDLDTFKEKKEEPVKLETLEPVAEKDAKSKEEIKPLEEKINEEATATIFKPVIKEEKIEEPIIEIPKTRPVFRDNEEESKPITINDLPELKEEDKKMELDLGNLKNIKEEFEKIEVPELTLKNEEVKPPYKPSQVFSSVYVNKEAEVKNEEIPKKDEEEKEMKLFTIEDDEEEMELPTLKTEEEKTFSFDDVNGETYDVK